MTVLRLLRIARSPDTDAELLARFVASRDEMAFAELVHRHGPLVYRVCRRMLDTSRADDAFQATFLVLATRADRVRKATSVGSWLVGVAGRVARQMRRRASGSPARRPVPREQEAARHVEAADLGRVLDEEFTRLPDHLRAVAVECLVNEKTQADAAKMLGESERTVRRRVAQAKALLRERLERRGVVPAVAGGLVSSIGTATAVPLPLAANTVAVVSDFLAGGAAVASVPAILAKGVAMSGVRKTLAAGVAVVAVGLSALGIGLADDKPQTVPTIPPTKVPVVAGVKASPLPPQPVGAFVVSGGDELVNRVIQREAEHQARVLGEKWIGKPLPALIGNWKILVKIDMTKTTGATTFTFGTQPKRGVLSSETQLTGSLEQILRVQLPHEVAHCVLAAHFGRPLPRWIDEGIAILSEPAKDQADHDRKAREFANAGRLIQLKTLLPMTEYPRDMAVLFTQGHSVARFLHARDPKQLLPLIEASFADGWDKALTATYGFKDAAALEEAWLAWLKQPGNVLTAAAKPMLADYKIEPPDILRIRFKPKVDDKYLIPADAEYMVRPDGTISLGAYGTVAVTGMTLSEATDAVQKVLKKYRVEGDVSVDVRAFNSKCYYIITDFAGNGEQVQRLPDTGNETVLDAIAKIGGLSKDSKVKVWVAVARRTLNTDKDQILPVDWKGVTSNGDTKTNYQLLPGDRVYIKAEK